MAAAAAATIACSLQGALGGAILHSRGVEEAKCLNLKLFLSKKNLSSFERAKLFHQCRKESGFSALASKRLVKAAAAVAGSATETKGTALLWFKHDLRLDDHPGVAGASAYKQVLPVYVFDPHVCVGEISHFLNSALASIEFELELHF